MHEIRLSIALPKDEYLALEKAGDLECRRPREHARWLLRQELIRLGLLPEQTIPTQHESTGDRQVTAGALAD